MQKRHFEMETVTAASCFEDLTLTIGLTPSDFIWQGFMQGKKDGCKEWPIEGEYVKDDLAYRWYGRNSVCKALEDCGGKTRGGYCTVFGGCICSSRDCGITW